MQFGRAGNLTRSSAPDVAALNSAAVRALAAGDANSAVHLLDQATSADPTGSALWVNLAAAHRALRNDAAERAALERALATDQRNFMALLRLAELHERTGDRVRAAARWFAVLALASQMAERPPALEPVLARAQAFVAEQNCAFGEMVDERLTPARAAHSLRELRRFDACMAAATGRRQIYTNHCEGLHFPFLPADEFFDRGHFPWLAELEAATPVIAAELRTLLAAGAEGMRPYVEMPSGTPPNKWTGLDGKLDWGAFFLFRFGERQEANIARCPETARIFERLPLADMPRRAPTAFFSILKPRTRLPAHTGVSNLRSICHLALVVPPDNGFRVGGETREWREGEAFVFDDTIEHEAWNDSDQLRAVLIFDVWNPYLTAIERGLVREYFQVTDASGFDTGLQVTE